MGVVVGGIALYKIWHFQSSPPPKERCNSDAQSIGSDVESIFQSSPPPKERCNSQER